MKSKKAMGPEALVIMISLLATAVIFLIILYPQWRGVTEKGTEGSAECSFELLLRNIIKKASFGFADAPVNCPVKKVMITNREIDKLMPLAKQVVGKSDYPLASKGEDEWIASKIIADELISCHNKGWKGLLSLSPTEQREWTEMMKQRLSKGMDNYYLCLICSRISFNSDTRIHNLGKFGLKSWLQNNYFSGQSYYDVLSRKEGIAQGNPLDEIMIDPTQSIAVMFLYPANGNPFIYSLNYKDINSFARTETILVPGGQPYTETGKCIEIIGEV